MISPYVQYMYSYPHKTAYRELTGIHLKDYVHKLSQQATSLYFHIPFCQSKCGYCNLFSVTGQRESFMTEYVNAMERHANQLSEVLPQEVYFSDLTLGGGTPLLLPEKQLERVFTIAENVLGFESTTNPVVVETSPTQTTKEKLEILKRHHVTRVSMGVQSFYDHELKLLNRAHCVAEVERAIALLKEADFPCLNLDLIYGIPGQTVEHLLSSAKRALSYEPEELFVYPLYIKEGTYLAKQGTLRPEDTYEMYVMLREYLKNEGYVPYSMRRFVKKGTANDIGSCGFDSTLSIGCGGRSYVGNLHFSTPYAVRQSACMNIINAYIGEKEYLQVRHGYVLSEEEQRRRYVIKNILFGCGIDKKEYQQFFGGEPEQDYPELISWVKCGLAISGKERIHLTEEGFGQSDYLGPMLISDEVREKMQQSEVSPFIKELI